MFENKEFEGIYYSRFIASYANVRGINDHFGSLRVWLRTLTINGKKMPEDVVWDIYNMATSGKLELEANCRNFFK